MDVVLSRRAFDFVQFGTWDFFLPEHFLHHGTEKERVGHVAAKHYLDFGLKYGRSTSLRPLSSVG